MSASERGGLPLAQFVLWEALGGLTSVWHPQHWMSSFGEVEGSNFYLIDLADPVAKIAIEVDGHEHFYRSDKDVSRDAWLISQGWKVLRYSNEEVMTSIDSVVERIKSECMT